MTDLVKPLTNHCLSSQPTFQAAFTDSEPPHHELNILTLNEDVFQAILSHLSYDEVAKLRLVCQQFNYDCQKWLNKGFIAVQRYHSQCLREMKAKLPRRESERRSHPLAKHIDVLTGVETRLSLLSMTYYKYTVLGVFCFIPGKVLDECYRVLREVVVRKNPPKSYELLQELRDISSMAMEHFEEHIVPTMKRNQILDNNLHSGGNSNNDDPFLPSYPMCSSYFRSAFGIGTSTGEMSTSSPCSPRVSSGYKLYLAVQQNRLLINSQRREIVELKTKVTEQDKRLSDYGLKIFQLEQKLSLSLSHPTTPVPSTPTKNIVMGTAKKRKRSHQDADEPSEKKRSKKDEAKAVVEDLKRTKSKLPKEMSTKSREMEMKPAVQKPKKFGWEYDLVNKVMKEQSASLKKEKGDEEKKATISLLRKEIVPIASKSTKKEKDQKAKFDCLEKVSKLDQHLAEKRKPNAQRNRKSILSRKGWKVT